MVEMSIRIYQAEDLPKMNLDLLSKIKDTLLRDPQSSTSPFVQVSFAGHTVSKLCFYLVDNNNTLIASE